MPKEPVIEIGRGGHDLHGSGLPTFAYPGGVFARANPISDRRFKRTLDPTTETPVQAQPDIECNYARARRELERESFLMHLLSVA